MATLEERVHLSPCDVQFDDQIIEFGVEVEDDEGNNIVLQPIDILFWEERMRKRRNKELKLAKVEVNMLLKDVDKDIERGGMENVEKYPTVLGFIYWSFISMPSKTL